MVVVKVRAGLENFREVEIDCLNCGKKLLNFRDLWTCIMRQPWAYFDHYIDCRQRLNMLSVPTTNTRSGGWTIHLGKLASDNRLGEWI